MKHQKRLLLGLILSLSTMLDADAAPGLAIEKDLKDWVQRRFPMSFPASPKSWGDRDSFRKYANGNLLTVFDGVLYVSGPASGDVMQLVGPFEHFKCSVYPTTGFCHQEFEPLFPRPQFVGRMPETMVVRDAVAFGELMAKKKGFPSISEMTIDWNRRMVVGVVLGPDTKPCSPVFIAAVRDEVGVIKVHYRVAAPFDRFRCDDPSAYAADFVTIARSTKPVEFIRY